jgi:hypothetical protein
VSFLVKKLNDYLENWFTKNQIAELIDCDSEKIDLLIKGLPVLTSKNESEEIVFIRLNDLKDYLTLVMEIAKPFLSNSKRTLPSKQKKSKKNYVPIEIPDNCFTGKKIAKKIGCQYQAIDTLINEHNLPIVKKFGKGYVLDLAVVERFISENKKLAESLKIPIKESFETTKSSAQTNEPNQKAVSNSIASKKETPEKNQQNLNNHNVTAKEEAQQKKNNSKNGSIIPAGDLEEENHRRSIVIDRTPSGCSITAIKNAIPNIDRTTIQKWISDKKIIADENGYIDADSLKQFLEINRKSSVTFVTVKFPSK